MKKFPLVLLMILNISAFMSGAETLPFDDYCFSYQRGLPMSVGSSSGISLFDLYSMEMDHVFNLIKFNENTCFTKTLGFTVRFLRTGIFDLYPVLCITLIQHEFFGHGARAREFGYKDSYSLSFPFFGKRSYMQYQSQTWNWDDWDKGVYIQTSGCEGNTYLGFQQQKRIWYSEKANHATSILMFINKFYLNRYITSTPSPRADPAGFYREYSDGGDIARYLNDMEIKSLSGTGVWSNFNGTYSINKTLIERYDNLVLFSLWNLLDPIVWSAMGSVATYLAYGKTAVKPVSFHYKNFDWIPGTRFNLTPLGENFYLDFFGKIKGFLYMSAYLSYLNGIYDKYPGLGIFIENIRIIKGLYAGVGLDFWKQQAMLKKGEYIYDVVNVHILNGWAIRSAIWYRPFRYIGANLEVLYKTEGILFGEQYSEGFRILFGLNFRL